MDMTDIAFLFLFLPAVFIAAALKSKWKNYALLLLSLFFYACGSPVYFMLFIAGITVNVLLAYVIQALRTRCRIFAVFVLAAGIGLDAGCLFYYKYFDFVTENVNIVFGTTFGARGILLPLGISFFTFKAISLLADVFSGKITLKKNPVHGALYLSFFSQIVSGPICRYGDFFSGKADFYRGGEKFVTGFVKKVLLADVLGLIVEEIFAAELSTTTPAYLWLGSICYSLRLYYDFSGYSDMAIGIGEMCGFSCMENFNYPYMTASVSGFWRRWHITLGAWFRDYVYIPMGGSRVNSKIRLYFNLFVVWLLTGIWHGASGRFIFWGLLYFLVIAAEKALKIPDKIHTKAGRVVYRLFVLLFINFQWVIFNSQSLRSGLRYIGHMFLSAGGELANQRTAVLIGEYWPFILAAIVFAFPVIPKLRSILSGNERRERIGSVIMAVVLCMLFIWAVSFVAAGQNNPFLYGNF